MLVLNFIILTFFGLISLFLNVFLLIVFIKGFNSLRKLPYFSFSLQILISALLSITVKFAYVIPHAASPEIKLSENYIALMALIETVAYHGELFFIFALAFHRLMYFVYVRLASSVYFTIVEVVFIWIMVFTFVACQCYFECFDTSLSPNSIENGIWQGVHFYSMCETDTVPKQIFKTITAIVNDYLPAFTFILYALILLKIRYDVNHFFKTFELKLLTEVQNQRNDFIILLQGITIYACFFIKFRILNTIGYGYDETSLNSMLRLLIFCSIYGRTMTQPIFLLFFNQNIRTIAKEIVSSKFRKNQISALTYKT
uniref:G-protein coupled receptors family 1 profile domain-containing protein n=1 Tax=Panagrolaimus sp. PS1159 TaxID=55785 RepID=A0AC35GR32_9BILA